MKVRRIRDMSDGEIRTAIDNAREELFNLRLQREVGTLEDYARIKELKHDVARMLTVLRERELAAAMVSANKEES